MNIRSRKEAAKLAERSLINIEGTCQLWVRSIYGAPSAGDQDLDGDADAVDGWLSEPYATRHSRDRTPPRGVPVAFSGGSRGYGHRAISLGSGHIRSTDMAAGGRYSAGHVGTVTINQIEIAMGVHYLGWSETIDGYPIPYEVKPPRRIRRTIKDLKNSIGRVRKAKANARERGEKVGPFRRLIAMLRRARRAAKDVK